jgi:hypothetical protein
MLGAGSDVQERCRAVRFSLGQVRRMRRAPQADGIARRDESWKLSVVATWRDPDEIDDRNTVLIGFAEGSDVASIGHVLESLASPPWPASPSAHRSSMAASRACVAGMVPSVECGPSRQSSEPTPRLSRARLSSCGKDLWSVGVPTNPCLDTGRKLSDGVVLCRWHRISA